MNLTKNIIVATALTGVLAVANLGAVQARDSAPEWKPMKPLYAVSFDVGRKHVLGYFLSKNGQCDLTILVTDRPDEAAEGDEIPTLTTARFHAAIDGGKSAQLDTAEGKSLEYVCARDAQAIRVREVNQVAVASPRPQSRTSKATLPLLAVATALAETPVFQQDEDLLTPQERVLSRNPHRHPGWTWMTESQAIVLLKAKGFSDVFRLERAGSSWRGKAINDHASYHVAIDRYTGVVAHLDKKTRESYAVAQQTQPADSKRHGKKRDAAKASKTMLATLNGPIAVTISQKAPTVLTPGKPVASMMGEIGWTWMKESQAKLILESKGYTNIRSLRRDAQGIWRAKAIHHGLALNVAIDIYSNVETQPESHGGLAQASPSD